MKATLEKTQTKPIRSYEGQSKTVAEGRRLKGDGSLQKLNRNGRTVRRLVLWIDGERRTKEMTATNNAARDEMVLYKQLITRLHTQEATQETKPQITVSQALEKWLENEKELVRRNERKETTVSGYRYIVKRINEKIGNKRIADLTVEQLTQFLNEMEVGLTRKRAYGLLMQRALPDTAMQEVQLPTKTQIKNEARERLESEREIVKNYKGKITKLIVSATSEDEAKQVRWWLRSIGPRQGEVLGLRLSDITSINGSKAYISITQQMVRHDQEISGKTGLHASTPKTENSERPISIPEDLRKKLRRVYDRRLREVGGDRSALLFVNTKGNPIRQQDDNEEWRQLCEEMGIEHFRPHLLRAMAATLLRDRGANDAEIMSAFGWNDLKMLNLYDKRGDARRTTNAMAKLALNFSEQDG